MACGGGGSTGKSSYYHVLGICRDASVSDIRSAYRKLAMKWHPDRYVRNPVLAGEAKRRFQQIQEACTVVDVGHFFPLTILNDENKRSMYDAGLYDPHDDDDDDDFCDFMQEMISMMNNVKDEGDSLEDLVGGDGMTFDCNNNPRSSKKPRVNISSNCSTTC